MNAPMMTPDPGPDDVAAETEAWLAAQTAKESEAAEFDPVDYPETQRVRDLRAEVAEAHQLLRYQADEAPLLLDTERVRKRRKQGAEAVRLHALARQPALLAWQADRWRRVLTWVAGVVLVLALGWSTAGVQAFAAEGAPAWSPGWCLAWLVEPFLSMGLLYIVATKAFMATRGQPLNDPALRKIEGVFLALTFGMNAWPHLPWSTDHFTVAGLVLHILGPIAAVAIVVALPRGWKAFADLDHGDAGEGYSRPYSAPTPGKYSGNGGAVVSPIEALTTRARALIAAGELVPNPSATQLRIALGCGATPASAVRDALRGDR